MRALEKIRQHVDKIESPILFIEQSVYQNLNEIAAKIHKQYRFTEQSVKFDFNPKSLEKRGKRHDHYDAFVLSFLLAQSCLLANA